MREDISRMIGSASSHMTGVPRVAPYSKEKEYFRVLIGAKGWQLSSRLSSYSIDLHLHTSIAKENNSTEGRNIEEMGLARERSSCAARICALKCHASGRLLFSFAITAYDLHRVIWSPSCLGRESRLRTSSSKALPSPIFSGCRINYPKLECYKSLNQLYFTKKWLISSEKVWPTHHMFVSYCLHLADKGITNKALKIRHLHNLISTYRMQGIIVYSYV